MKKLCFFSGDITRSGGTEKVSCQIMSGLIKTNCVTVLSLTESNKDMFYFLPPSIKRYRLFSHNPNCIKSYVSIVKRVRNFIKKNNIDILIDVDSILDMFSVVAVWHTKTKLVSWEHFNFYESMGNKLRIPVRKYMTRHADCIVTLTQEDQKNFQCYFGNKLLIKQIYNPIEMIETECTYDINSKTIISVGRLAYQKGFDILLDIAAIVLTKYPDWNWIILGDGDDKEILEHKRKKLGLERVNFLGRITNVSTYLQKSALFVMTSRYEGFPLVLIEAKEYKLPIVAFRCKTGPSELVQDNVNGYLVDCFDVVSMAEKICSLIEDFELRKKFSENAFLDVDKMNYPKIISQWNELLQKIVSE